MLVILGVLITVSIIGSRFFLRFGFPTLLFTLLIGLFLGNDAYWEFDYNYPRPTLQFESATNDPMAFFLTMTLVVIHQNPETGLFSQILMFVWSMGIGLISGFVISKLYGLIITKIRLKKGQNPVLIFGMVILLYAVNSVVGGSAFVAVYVAGISLGMLEMKYKQINEYFFEGYSWLMETILFLILGLQMYLTDLRDVWIEGLVISGVLIFLARPVGVYLSLLPFKWLKTTAKSYISWVGLRGATPIVFGLIPIVHNIPFADKIFNISFVVVLSSILLQGMSLEFFGKKFGVNVQDKINL